MRLGRIVHRPDGAQFGKGEVAERDRQRPAVLGADGGQVPAAGGEVHLARAQAGNLGLARGGQDQQPDEGARLGRFGG
jgi:hypothetical protein